MPSLPRPGDRLAGFRIERELGHGTTGVVFLAHQEALDRRVALKVVGLPSAGDPAFRERFRREARAVAGLDHPNVVQILESGEDDAHLWLAMRLVDGPDLRVLLRRTDRLDPEQAVVVVEQIAAALDAAHAAGLVHRDVKPSNVLIEDGPGRDLHVELADFGLARAPGVDDPEGTPGYAAPEQLAGEEAGPAADVFGLGCVLFELLTGTPPPSPVAASARPAVGPARDTTHLPLRPSAAYPRLGGAFDPAVERATDPDPDVRFASAGELAMWARAALTVPRDAVHPPTAEPLRIAVATPAAPDEVAPAAPTWEIPPSERPRRRGRRRLVALFLVAILAALGSAFVFIGNLGDASRDRAAGTTPTPPGGPGTGTGATAASGAGRGSSGGSGSRAGGSSSGAAGSGSGGTGSSAGGSGPSSAGSGSGSSAASAAGGASGSSSGGSARSSAAGRSGSDVPLAGRGAPTGSATAPLPPVPAGAVRFGGGGWTLDLPAAEGWRQTAVQELEGGARILTRLMRPDASRLVVEALPGRTAVAGVVGGSPFPVRLPDAGRTDGVLFRGGRYAMCATGICAALPVNGPGGGVLLVASTRRAYGAKRVTRRAAAGLRVR
ncbi:serine/threonine-protein kinase [Patulibacter sp. NPDC049589]|uniref:serine/threonine-protein kinase n=1 Tax=Patulibacter sp. NPDC049589 TaxID=3154731 RepID=UPI0034384D94